MRRFERAYLRRADGISGGYRQPPKPVDENCLRCWRPIARESEQRGLCWWCNRGVARGA